MSENDHKYRFHGFPGKYWEKKAERERAMQEMVSISEELGLYDLELSKDQDVLD